MFVEKTMVGSDAFPIEMVPFLGGRLLVFRGVATPSWELRDIPSHKVPLSPSRYDISYLEGTPLKN